MQHRTLLFIMNEATPETDLREIADQAAAQEARVICLLLSRAPAYPLTTYGAMPYGAIAVPDEWVEAVNETKEKLRARGDELEAFLQRTGVSGDVHPVQCVLADVRQAVAQRALVSDIACIAPNIRKDDTHLFRAVTQGVLFDSPIALMLNGPPLAMPRCVFVAWNTELPASRAIHAALPLLKAAQEVVVASFDPDAVEGADGEDPGSDLARWLSHHGCTVTVNQYPSGGEGIGASIERRAREVGADLIVMGAYGRSRMREFVFGGITHRMLEQTETPVLMAH